MRLVNKALLKEAIKRNYGNVSQLVAKMNNESIKVKNSVISHHLADDEMALKEVIDYLIKNNDYAVDYFVIDTANILRKVEDDNLIKLQEREIEGMKGIISQSEDLNNHYKTSMKILTNMLKEVIKNPDISKDTYFQEKVAIYSIK